MITGACTLCISTYNWPEALKICLDSVLRQQLMPAEVIIGDDGSREETALLVKQYQAIFPVPLIHVWQPDDGFKLAQIRNKTFARASQPYIVQIDGDLALHPHFIAHHLRFASKGSFVCGARGMLSPAISQSLLSGNILLDKLSWKMDGLEKKYNTFSCLPLAHINYWIQRGSQQYKYVIGANMAFWKADLIQVNGYNEAFTGWGKEDNELALRLCNAGINLRFIKFAAIAFHIFHKSAEGNRLHENEQLLLQTVTNNISVAPSGLDSYL